MAALSQAEIERCKALAHKLAMQAQTEVGDSEWGPLLALAALTTAACEVAVITDTTFSQLMELVQLHYQAAAVGITLQEMGFPAAPIVKDDVKS